MRMSIFAPFISACLIAISASASLIDRIDYGLMRVVRFVCDLLPVTDTMRDPSDRFALRLDAPGRSLEPSLLNSLRHEAGQRRLAAARSV